MKTMKSLAIATLIILIGFSANSQEEKQEADSRHAPFQLTFIYPLSTNGFHAKEFTNDVSLNLIAGYSGGLSGVGFSGFAGHLQYNMNGLQIAGFSNSVLGKGEGVQFSGFSNYIKESFTGVQVTGFSNVANSHITGIQFSGFSNVTTGPTNGFQAAGFANYSRGNHAGQLSGFANINTGNQSGIQVSGFANVTTEEVVGTQISGFFNSASKLNGLQLGLVNYVDSLQSGTVIGVFNYVKNGYQTMEVSSSETLYGMATFKSGTRGFYTMISVGASPRDDMLLWGWGFGLGTIIKTSKKTNLAIEGFSYHISEDEWFTDRLNLLNKLRLTESWEVTKNVSLFAGASWNVVVADNEDEKGNPMESSIAPWTQWTKTSGGTDIQMYPGFTAGLRF